MINDQLLGYVRKQLSLKVPKETIATNLKGAGWTDEDIKEVFTAVEPISTPVPTPSPVSAVATNVTQSSTDSFHPEHSKSKRILPIIFTLILISLAGGAAAYTYYTGAFVSLPKILSESMERAKVTKSSSHDITFYVDFSGIKDVNSPLNSLSSVGINSQQISLLMKGVSDVNDTNNLKISSNISFTLGGYLSTEVEFRLVNNTFYVELKKAPTLANFPLPVPSITQYENKWFSFPVKLINKQITANPSSLVPSSEDSMPADIFTTDQKDQLYKIFQSAHLIKPLAKLTPETVGGEPSYHFSFDLDKDAVIAYFQSLKTYLSTINKDNVRFSDFDAATFSRELDKIVDFKGEIWIGRNDKLVHKVNVNFGVQPDIAKNEQVKISMVSITSDYNQPVSVIAPAESTPFADLIAASLESARQKGKEASIKANLANMRAQAELFYDQHNNAYLGFCLSKELKVARKAIEDVGGTGFVCLDRKKAYAMGVKLSQNSGYFCVDSTGFSKETTDLPDGTVCPLE